MPLRLTTRELENYDRDGFVVVENLLPPGDVAALLERLREYTHGGRSTDGLTVQIEPRIQRGELHVDHPGDGIRKVEHLVEQDDLFRALGLNDNIAGIVSQILGPDIKMFRNSLLLKPPGVGSAKGMHQDSPYWPIEPMDLCSCWFALDDATPENGCMQVIPGWHKRGLLPHVGVTDDYVIPDSEMDWSLARMAPIPAGAGLFFHSLLPHYTAPNQSQKWRRAIALSYMSSESKYTHEGAGPEYLQVSGRSFEGCVL